jgi:hypothetical protein
MNEPALRPNILERYLRHRGLVAAAFWIVTILINAWANTEIARLDLAKTGLHFADWEVASWEWSSHLVFLLLIPAIAWLDQRLPLVWGSLRRSIALHVLGSIGYGLVHVAGMVGIRILVYKAHGRIYDFGDPVAGFFYEYMKDARTYLSTLVIIHLYRMLVLRARGEARLLNAPDEGPALEPVERPTRFLVRKLGREFLVAAADIERAQAAGNYVNLRVRGREYPLRSTIGGLETRLDSARFIRVHRSVIVNLEHLAEIEAQDSGDARLRMSDGEYVPCSRRYLAALRQHVVGEPAPRVA